MCCHSCQCKEELRDWITNKKFWPNWVGLILSTFAALISIKYDATFIAFSSWKSNITESNDISTVFGTMSLFPLFFCSFALCDYATNHTLKRKEIITKILVHLRGFTVFYILSIICFIVGSQTNMKQYGLGYALLSLIMGIFIVNITTNICKTKYILHFLEGATSNGEFYIKCGLVLLATDLKTIVSVGAPGLIIAWIIPPLIIIFMWYFATKILKHTNREFVISLATGTAICGVSAICAVAAVVGLSSEETATAISILSFFTIIYMFALPYIALYTGLDKIIAGAWIGGSVDGTGNVVASAGILDDDEAYETAVLIKMAQNILIGVVCLVVAVIFKQNDEHSLNTATIAVDDEINIDDTDLADDNRVENVETNKTSEKPNKQNAAKERCYFLWEKFPKFILGYLFLSIIISVCIQPFASETYSSNFMSNIKQLSKWSFCFGFLGIGSSTIFDKLFIQLKDGKSLTLYLVGQTVDTFVTLLVAWFVVELIYQ